MRSHPSSIFLYLKTLINLTVLIGVFFVVHPVWANYWVDVCPGGQKGAGLPARQGPFATKSEAQSFADEENGRGGICFTVSGSDDATSSTGGSDASTGLSSLNQSAYLLGQAIGDRIRADDAAAKEREDELERQKAEAERYEVEQRRLKYEASKNELLNNLRDSSQDSGNGLREVGTSDDGTGLRDVGSDNDRKGFMQGPAKKMPKVKHGAVYKYHLALKKTAAGKASKPKPDPTPKPKVAGVQHANLLKDGVQLTGNPESPLKDLLWVENNNDYAVDIHVWMAGDANCAHSMRNNLHLEAHEKIKVGWVANTTNEDPWNYQPGMNVTRK